MDHRPTITMATADNLEGSDFGMPQFYSNPEWYANLNQESDTESLRVLQEIQGNPDAEVIAYRAGPVNELNTGDWVTLSPEYASLESKTEGTNVHQFNVKAKDLQFAGDSINEFGYFPESEIQPLRNIWEDAQAGVVESKPVYVEPTLDTEQLRQKVISEQKQLSKYTYDIGKPKGLTINQLRQFDKSNQPYNVATGNARSELQEEGINWATGEKETLTREQKVKERQRTKTIKASPYISNQIKERIGVQTYNPISLKEEFQKAMDKVVDNPDVAYEKFMDIKTYESAQDVALGEALTKYYSDLGTKESINRAVRITDIMVEKATTQAQILAAHKLLSKSTPQAMLRYAERQVKKMKNQLGDKYDDIRAKVESSYREFQNTVQEAEIMELNDSLLKLNLQFFAEKMKKTTSEAEKALRTTKKDLGLKMNDILKSSNSIDQAKNQVTDYLRQKMSASDYKKIKPEIEAEFDKMVDRSRSSKLRSLLKKRPKYVRKTDYQKLLQYTALGKQGDLAIRDLIAKKFNSPDLTMGESEYIVNSMKKVEQMPESRAKDIELAKIYRVIQNKAPRTIREQLAAIQRINFLLNVVTQTRNLGSNVGMQTLEGIKDFVALPTEMLATKISGKKAFSKMTKADIDKAWTEAMRGIEEVIGDFKEGVITDFSGGKYDISQKEAFKNDKVIGRFLNKMDATTTMLLRLGDAPFKNFAEALVLNQLMRANNVDVPTPEMRKIAHEEALKRVFQNESAFAEATSRARGALRGVKGPLGKGIDLYIQTKVPFSKTIANIADTAFEYSGGGFVKAIADFKKLKSGDLAAHRKWVNEVSRSLTGLGIMYLAYTLAKAGAITGGYDENPKVRKMQETQGFQPYSLKIGDNYVSLNWAEPSSVLIAAGSDMHHKLKEKPKETVNAFTYMQILANAGTEGFSDHPVLSNLYYMGNSVNYKMQQQEDKNLTAAIGEVMAEDFMKLPAQLIPTVVNQVGRLIDPTKREYYNAKGFDIIRDNLKAKIPGLTQELTARTDPFGKELRYSEGIKNPFVRFVSTMVSPGTISKEQTDYVYNEILNTYNKNKNSKVLPKNPPSYIKIAGVKYKLTPKEKILYKELMGETLYNSVKEAMGMQEYQSASAEEKEEILRILSVSAQEVAKYTFIAHKTKDVE